MNHPRFPDVAIGDHCTIDPSARVGAGVEIHSHTDIGADVSIGPASRIGAGVQLTAGTSLGNGVCVEAGVVFAPASTPREAAVVHDGAVVAAGAVVGAGVVIGAKALIRPGAVVTRSVPAAAIVEGNPAAIVGYVNAHRGPTQSAVAVSGPSGTGVEKTSVKGVSVYTLPIIADMRGDLTVGEFNQQIPFAPLRYFMVFGVPNKEVRGEHAHRKCHQFLICVRGSCAVMADDGEHRVEVLLDSPNRGIHLPPMVWGVQYKYSSDALLLVFASHHYEAADYVRDYDDFLALIAA